VGRIPFYQSSYYYYYYYYYYSMAAQFRALASSKHILNANCSVIILCSGGDLFASCSLCCQFKSLSLQRLVLVLFLSTATYVLRYYSVRPRSLSLHIPFSFFLIIQPIDCMQDAILKALLSEIRIDSEHDLVTVERMTQNFLNRQHEIINYFTP